MKIVADDKIPFLRGVFEPYAEVSYLPGAKISPADVRDADALIVRTRTKCNHELLAGSRVKIVATATIGFDHIDAAALAALGIEWRNAPGCNAESVKNYISGALAAMNRDLTGMTFGVIGVGHVGKKVADAAAAFGMHVLLNDPPRADAEGRNGFVELEELLKKSDIVSMHVPLETSGPYPTVELAGETFFESIKPGAWFFNSCRGEAMKAEPFKRARRNGRVAGALIDVWPGEPELDPEMVALVDFGTPHIAGYSNDGKANGTAASVQTVARVLGINELTTWRPATLPPPVYPPEIILDATEPVWQQLRHAILHAYDIRRDSDALRKTPNAFEALRGNYWVRREFSAYTVSGASPEAARMLTALGFQLASSRS